MGLRPKPHATPVGYTGGPVARHRACGYSTVHSPRAHTILAVTGVAIAASVLLVPARAEQAPGIPSPEQFFGFAMGTERRLAHWDQIVDYFALVADRSDRVAVRELGKSTLGQPYILAAISTPDTIAALPRYQAMQRALADPRRTSQAAADEIARSGKAVVLIGANVHATEIGPNQMMNDLVHQLATEQSPWVDHVLDNTIVLLIPSQNPDGQRMVVDWYRRNLDTRYEGSPLPELYHPYAGHDNNRDSYMLTQVETQHLNRVLYHEWLPEVYVDKHQMGNTFARMFVPPFKDPPNPNVDPLVWSEVNLLGQAMAARLHEADKPGVIWGEIYSAYWQGANNTNPWWHNMVALLTETASARLATPVEQDRVGTGARRRPAGRRTRAGRGRWPVPPPTDVQYRMNYPRPWMGGRWTLADVVEYERLATRGLLEGVANNRAMLKRNFYLMNRRTIDRFAEGSPYAYLVPAPVDQHDPAAVTHLLQLLQAEAAEVHVAAEPFTADGREYAAGTYVLPLAQPFGRWIKDILEAQEYPDARWPSADADFDRPYDVTAWSLGMLMGVETIRVERPFDARLTALTDTVERPQGGVRGDLATGSYLLPSASTQSVVAINRLLAAGATLAWTRDAFELAIGAPGASQRVEPGTVLVEDVHPDLVTTIARDLGLEFYAAVPPDPIAILPIQRPRLGVVEPWGGNRDAGWTRWVLEQHEFPYQRLRSADLRRPDLIDRFDVIILPELSSADLLRGLQGPMIRPAYRGGIGATGVRALQRFVEDGGAVIALGNSATFAVDYLGVPITNTVRDASQDAFFGPGSILRVEVDTSHPIAYGMPPEADVMFVDNGAWVPTAATTNPAATTVVRYPETPLVRSGWMRGEERLRGACAVIEAPIGLGRVILHTFRVQHRGQTWGTFKLLFNSIFYGQAMKGRQPAPTTLGAP